MIISAEQTSESVSINRKVYSKSQAVSMSSRAVMILDDVVLKFDNGTTGFKAQCQQEALTYNMIKANDKKYFARVIDSGNNWLVMKKVNFVSITDPSVTDEEYNTAKKVLARLENQYKLIDLSNNNTNYGIDTITRKLVIFDFLSSNYHKGYFNNI
jgi:hypothetical protein